MSARLVACVRQVWGEGWGDAARNEQTTEGRMCDSQRLTAQKKMRAAVREESDRTEPLLASAQPKERSGGPSSSELEDGRFKLVDGGFDVHLIRPAPPSTERFDEPIGHAGVGQGRGTAATEREAAVTAGRHAGL